jgi:cell division protein FtsQ
VRASAPVEPPEPKEPLLSTAASAAAGAFVRWRRSFLLAGVGLALAGGAWLGRWYVTHARHFAVQTVRATPTSHVSAEALITRAGVPLGLNLFAVDRDEVARAVSQEPWVARAHVRRELPSTVVLEVVERQAVCATAFGALYLTDAEGSVFKRAAPDEAVGLPVVTGLGRDDYLAQPERTRASIRQALQALAAWRQKADRPPLGEVHIDRIAGVTLYTDRGVGVRLGVIDDTLSARLARYDAVAGELARGVEEPRLIYVDNRARPDRVTVKLASAQLSAHSGSRD